MKLHIVLKEAKAIKMSILEDLNVERFDGTLDNGIALYFCIVKVDLLQPLQFYILVQCMTQKKCSRMAHLRAHDYEWI